MKHRISSVLASVILVLGMSAAAAVPGAAAAKAPGPEEAGALRVEGTHLVGKNGEAVRLRGVSTHGLQWFPQYVSKETFRDLRESWNANVVRLALYTEESGWCASGEAERQELRGVLHDGIRYAAENDLYVILDWHILSDGDPNRHAGEAAAFFEEFSSAYRDADHILYEICNEPNGGTSWEQIRSYAEKMIPVIRANDPDAVILIGTPTWSQDIDRAMEHPVQGYGNLMYTLHFYAATHGQYLRDRLQKAVAGGLPVFVTECGLCSADGNGWIDRESAAAWLEAMDRNGISCVFWNLCNKNEAAALLSPSCGKLSGFSEGDLSESGRIVREYLTD